MGDATKKLYRVTLPLEVGGRVYQFGEEIELDATTATEYSHALSEVEQEEKK